MAMSVHTIEESFISPILQIALGSWRKHCICRLNWVLFWFQGHCLSQCGCCTAAWPPPRVPWDMPWLCSWLSVFCIIYHGGNCLKCWPLAWTFLSTFFFYLKARRASFIIHQHFLGGHTFFSLLSGLTQLPSVLLSTRGPPVLDNTLHCYMKKNELWWESEILSPFIVCPVSCVLLIAASLYIHACKLPLLSFIPKKKLNVNNVYYLLISPWILDKHMGREFLESMYYTLKRIKGVISV